MHDWLGRQRRKAASLVSRYFEPLDWLKEKINNTNPRHPNDPPCLAIHIRLSDKSGVGRNRNSLDMFLPFAQAFVAGGGSKIFVASDTAHIFDDIQSQWPANVVGAITRQSDVFLSNSDEGVFALVSHHRSNTEALTEIYAMAKCSLLVHGFSAMTEAAIWLNPSLHDFSINLDYDPVERRSIYHFENMVQRVLGH